MVLLLIDDWAWYGSSIRMDDSMENSAMPIIKMPNLEKLQREGMKFRNAYAGAPQCAPSRVCIQTGKSSARSGFTLYLGNNKEDYFDTRKSYEKLRMVPNVLDMSIDADAVTIPEALKPLGYASAHVGKWHMGGDPDDEGYLVHDGNVDNKPGSTILKLQRLPENHSDPKLMFSVTEKSIDFMRDQVSKKTPFYLQISHYSNVIHYDFLPTFVDWAGGDPESLKDIDGVSLADYYAGKKKPEPDFLNRYLYFHLPHYREALPSSAIVSGSKKLMHFYERPDVPMLFDLASDEGEVVNVAKKMPEQHKQLFDEMMRYLEQVGGRIPKVNPDYDPEHYKTINNYDERMAWGPFEGARALEDDEQ